MHSGRELELIRKIMCYNQAKSLSYFNEMGKRHWEMSHCLRKLKQTGNYLELKEKFENFLSFADRKLKEATDRNFEFVEEFFENANPKPRICIKANYNNEIVDLFRHKMGNVEEGFSYKENTGFEWCVEKGTHYLCNDIPKEAKDNNYKNPRLEKELIDKRDSNPSNSEDWEKYWRGYGDNKEIDDPKSAYKSTLIVPIALQDEHLSKNFKERLGFNENARHTIWGYLCFDHKDDKFFDEKKDVDFGYIMADLLSLYLITRANFTVHSKTFNTVYNLISLGEEA